MRKVSMAGLAVFAWGIGFAAASFLSTESIQGDEQKKSEVGQVLSASSPQVLSASSPGNPGTVCPQCPETAKSGPACGNVGRYVWAAPYPHVSVPQSAAHPAQYVYAAPYPNVPGPQVAARPAQIAVRPAQGETHPGGSPGGPNWEAVVVPVRVSEMMKSVESLARLAATLESHESMLAMAQKLNNERSETLSDVAELLAAKAKLEAQVEYHAEHEKWMRELHELSTENARLQSELQLAKAETDLAHEFITLSAENAQLKKELESARTDRSVQTAKRNTGAKRAR